MISCLKVIRGCINSYLEGSMLCAEQTAIGLACQQTLIIVQTMMRTAKSRGGLTHGRGMSESV